MDIVNNFTLNSFLDLIEQELKAKHLIPALFIALAIPDICNGENTGKEKYIKWFDDWVVRGNTNPIIDGKICYGLRCGILHSGTTNRPYSLCCDSKNDIHIGHIISTLTDETTGESSTTIKVNINELVENILRGAKLFIESNGDIKLFSMIDYGAIPHDLFVDKET